ncbi:hypothetical protein D3C76_1335400 [compost metagenome]
MEKLNCVAIWIALILLFWTFMFIPMADKLTYIITNTLIHRSDNNGWSALQVKRSVGQEQDRFISAAGSNWTSWNG